MGDPFDGIMGFSNGAAVAAMVAATACAPTQASNGTDGRGYDSIKFGIFCSGYRPDALQRTGPLTNFASLHMYGDSDPFISLDQTTSLLAFFADPAPICHTMRDVK